MGDDKGRRLVCCMKLRRIQKAAIAEVLWNESTMADLRLADDAEPGGSGIRRLHEGIEATQEGPDGHKDHSSGPRLRVARGKAQSFSGH